MHLFLYGSDAVGISALVWNVLDETGVRQVVFTGGCHADHIPEHSTVFMDLTRGDASYAPVDQEQVMRSLDRPCQIIGIIENPDDPIMDRLRNHPLARFAEVTATNRDNIGNLIRRFLVQPPLAEALGILPKHRGRGQTIAIIGGGGKTTLMYMLAHELSAAGYRTIVTTTTHIRKPVPGQAPFILETDETCRDPQHCKTMLEQISKALDQHPLLSILQTAGPKEQAEGKMTGPPPAVLARLPDLADYVLVEADGSRGLPLKAPAAHEPVYPPRTDHVLALAGLSALGRPLQKICHRADLAARRLGCGPEHRVRPDDLARLVFHPQGQLKDLPAGARLGILLNQADTLMPNGLLGVQPPAEALHTARLLADLGADHVYITALQSAVPVLHRLTKERGSSCSF
jgi:probable selenium-dependent hydroxylase accessory protein YqeC